MSSLSYGWENGEFTLVHVQGTRGDPYTFGDPPDVLAVEVGDFFIGTVPVTQAFWDHIAGAENNPAVHRGSDLPVENVSWDSLTQPDGFLERLNASPAAAALRAQLGRPQTFRLPTETEWEYAARGGPHWRDGYRYSGSDDIDAVAWYDRRHGDQTQPVARKAPNQLGLYDMSGNIWEWCQDSFSRDLSVIPTDGSAYAGSSNERVLRGGCFHNWAAHCTVCKRYEIARDFHDGCIGLRVVMAEPRPSTPRGA
jgi:formylglycine-generating enzyme required for sulfatase activity